MSREGRGRLSIDEHPWLSVWSPDRTWRILGWREEMGNLTRIIGACEERSRLDLESGTGAVSLPYPCEANHCSQVVDDEGEPVRAGSAELWQNLQKPCEVSL